MTDVDAVDVHVRLILKQNGHAIVYRRYVARGDPSITHARLVRNDHEEKASVCELFECVCGTGYQAHPFRSPPIRRLRIDCSVAIEEYRRTERSRLWINRDNVVCQVCFREVVDEEAMRRLRKRWRNGEPRLVLAKRLDSVVVVTAQNKV